MCFLCSLNAANEFGLRTSQEIKGCFWDLISIHSPVLEMGHSGDELGSLANSLDSRQWWGRRGRWRGWILPYMWPLERAMGHPEPRVPADALTNKAWLEASHMLTSFF